MEWAQELAAAHQLGTALCGTEFVPSSFRGKPEAAAAAILAGKSLGLDPMNALANIFVVSGRPSMYARTMAALVLQAGHTIRRVQATDQSVIYEGGGDTTFTRVEWTIARAQKAGYTSNKKYQSDPIAMLTAKCQAEICRVIAPDVLTGIAATSVEEVELDDLGETDTGAATEAPKAKRTITRKQQPAPELPAAVHDAPAPEDEPAPEDTPDDASEPGITTPQLTKLNIILQEQGLTDRDDKLNYLSTYLGRSIESSKDVTKSEAHRLIDEHETGAQ